MKILLKKFVRIIIDYQNIIQIEDCTRQVVLEEGSRFYPEALVRNIFGEPRRIRIGKNSHIRGELVTFGHGGDISIGDNCYIGKNTSIWSGESIVIEDNVLISHNCNIIDSNSHEINHLDRARNFRLMIRQGHSKEKGNIITAPIVVREYAWISFNCCILKGVTIGRGAIVAAGSVVTRDVPDFVIVAGNPATIVKQLELNA